MRVLKGFKMNSIKKNFFYNTAYQMLIILIPVLTTPYISRILGAEGTGRYSYAYSVAYYFVMFAMLGLNNYGNRTIAMVRENHEELSKTFCSIYIFQLITSTMMIVFYIVYCMFISDDNIISWILLLYVVSAAFDINWLFFGLELFKVTITRNLIIKSLTVISIFVFVKDINGIYIYALIYSFGMLISQLLLWGIVKKYISFKRVSLYDIKKHIKPNIILFAPVLAISLYKVMDKIMLGMISTKTEVGYYEASEKIIQIPLALINSLGTVMLPRMANLLANNEIDKSKQYIKKSITFAVFLSTSMAFGIMAIADDFVPLFYGNGFGKCVYLFWIFLPSCIFIAFANVIRTQYLIPNRKDKIYILSVFVGAIVNLFINSLLIGRLQSVGAAIGTLIAEIMVCIIQCWAVRKELPIIRYILDSFPFFFAGLLMFIGLKLVPLIQINAFSLILLKVIIGIVLYAVCLLLMILLKKIVQQKLRQS